MGRVREERAGRAWLRGAMSRWLEEKEAQEGMQVPTVGHKGANPPHKAICLDALHLGCCLLRVSCARLMIPLPHGVSRVLAFPVCKSFGQLPATHSTRAASCARGWWKGEPEGCVFLRRRGWVMSLTHTKERWKPEGERRERTLAHLSFPPSPSSSHPKKPQTQHHHHHRHHTTTHVRMMNLLLSFFPWAHLYSLFFS